jgi:hypothetical protein
LHLNYIFRFNNVLATFGLDSRIKTLQLIGGIYSGPSLSFVNSIFKSNDSDFRRISKFTYDWLIRNNQINDNLSIPLFSPHDILVPLSLAFMTIFIVNNIKNKKFMELLAKMIIEVSSIIQPGDNNYKYKTGEVLRKYRFI